MVPRDGVVELDPRELRLAHAVPAQQRGALVVREHRVRRHEHVVRDVDQQLLLLEHLDLVPRGHLGKALPSERSERGSRHDDGTADPLASHALGVRLDHLDADFWFLGEEDEDLVGRVVLLRDEDGEVVSARNVAVLLAEGVEGRVEVVLVVDCDGLDFFFFFAWRLSDDDDDDSGKRTTAETAAAAIMMA